MISRNPDFCVKLSIFAMSPSGIEVLESVLLKSTET